MKRSSKLTRKCKSLYADSVTLTKQLRRMRKTCLTFKNRVAAAKSVSDNMLNSKLSSSMATAATIFTRLQLRETINKPKGRRFTLEEKLLSLSLYKKSAKSRIVFYQNSLHYLVEEHFQIYFLNYLQIPVLIKH